MIGWRGPIAFVVGAFLVVWVGHPDLLDSAEPPMWLRLYVGFFGVLFIAVGLYVCWFTLKRRALVAQTLPQPCMIDIHKEDDGEDVTYRAFVRWQEQYWKVMVAGRRAVKNAVGQGPTPGNVWAEPDTSMPMALTRQGEWLETIPVPQRVTDED